MVNNQNNIIVQFFCKVRSIQNIFLNWLLYVFSVPLSPLLFARSHVHRHTHTTLSILIVIGLICFLFLNVIIFFISLVSKLIRDTRRHLRLHTEILFLYRNILKMNSFSKKHDVEKSKMFYFACVLYHYRHYYYNQCTSNEHNQFHKRQISN